MCLKGAFSPMKTIFKNFSLFSFVLFMIGKIIKIITVILGRQIVLANSNYRLKNKIRARNEVGTLVCACVCVCVHVCVLRVCAKMNDVMTSLMWGLLFVTLLFIPRVPGN